jgi:hypothetical protein
MSDSASWTAAGALGALISAAVAAAYTYFAYRLIRAQTEPNVVVYVRHDESRRSVIQIVIENIGRGLASDIRFSTSRPIPSRALGLSLEEARSAADMTEGPLIEGIPALGPGDSRKITWGQYGGLHKALGDEIITVKCEYRHGQRHMPRATFQLDVRSFKATDAIESEGARIIGQLERIAAALERSPDR